MRALSLLLVLLHAGVGAVWLGAMAYSLAVVQPWLARLAGSAVAAEDSYRELAAGNRWRVVALLAVLGSTGAGLVATVVAHSGRSTVWWVLMATKTVLFVVASALFWWVSWRGWPRRVFALPAELPGQQRVFRRVAVALVTVVGAAFALGVAAAWLPD